MSVEPRNELQGASLPAWMADPELISSLRRQMVHFAALQLGDASQAEDVVQEALLGAMSATTPFAGRSALRTWLFAILKHKIADLLRQAPRWLQISQLAGAEMADEGVLEQLFDAHQHWQPAQRPVRWQHPEQATEESHFWRVFELCLEVLPPAQGRVFMMREFIELESDEICQATGVSMSNLNVLLHRARLRLRHCLETNWFES